MKRILTYVIDADASGWHILTFLKHKQYSHSVITQLKKTENGILVNGRWAYVNEILKEGDVLTIQLIEMMPDRILSTKSANKSSDSAYKLSDSANRSSDSECVHKTLLEPPYAHNPANQECNHKMSSTFDIIYEDNDLLAVNKPAGMPIHPSIEHYGDTLADAVYFYAQSRQEWYPYRCINRLDRDTSGLTIIAKNAYSSCMLYHQMRERKIHRTYYAIAEGLTDAYGTIDAPISRREDSVIERVIDFSKGERAVTHYERLAYKNDLSFLKICLETGRTHQIRVHMRHIGHPLIGDFLYNPNDSHMKRQALHAGNLEFAHPVSGRMLTLYAPLPDDMMHFFNIAIPKKSFVYCLLDI